MIPWPIVSRYIFLWLKPLQIRRKLYALTRFSDVPDGAGPGGINARASRAMEVSNSWVTSNWTVMSLLHHPCGSRGGPLFDFKKPSSKVRAANVANATTTDKVNRIK
jgi:hypothetical protein